MENLKRCLEQMPRRPGTAHSHIIEWLIKRLEEL
jgi:hypothetical protein